MKILKFLENQGFISNGNNNNNNNKSIVENSANKEDQVKFSDDKA
jgi:hypothetical protein